MQLHGNFMATRERAVRLRETVKRKIENSHVNKLVTLDFVDVQDMTWGFTVEFLGELYGMISAGTLPQVATLRMVNVNHGLWESIDECLAGENLVGLVMDEGKSTLLGYTGGEQRIFDQLVESKSLCNHDIAKLLGITTNVAGHQTRRLARAAVIFRRRDPNGPSSKKREFVNHFIADAVPY